MTSLFTKAPIDIYLDTLEYLRPKIPTTMVITLSKEAINVINEVFNPDVTIMIAPKHIKNKKGLNFFFNKTREKDVIFWTQLKELNLKHLFDELNYVDFNHLKVIYALIWGSYSVLHLGYLYEILRKLRKMFFNIPIIVIMEVPTALNGNNVISVINKYLWFFNVVKNKYVNGALLLSFESIYKIVGYDHQLKLLKGANALALLLKLLLMKESELIKYISSCSSKGIVTHILSAILGINVGVLRNNVLNVVKLAKLGICHEIKEIKSSFNIIFTKKTISVKDINEYAKKEGLGREVIHTIVTDLEELLPELTYYVGIYGIKEDELNKNFLRSIVKEFSKINMKKKLVNDDVMMLINEVLGV